MRQKMARTTMMESLEMRTRPIITIIIILMIECIGSGAIGEHKRRIEKNQEESRRIKKNQ